MGTNELGQVSEMVDLLSPIIDEEDRRKLANVLLKKAKSLIESNDKTDLEKLKRINSWFYLKLVLGYVSIFLLTIVMLFASYIILNCQKFDGYIVKSAIGALFVDILGVLVFTWKVILKSE